MHKSGPIRNQGKHFGKGGLPLASSSMLLVALGGYFPGLQAVHLNKVSFLLHPDRGPLLALGVDVRMRAQNPLYPSAFHGRPRPSKRVHVHRKHVPWHLNTKKKQKRPVPPGAQKLQELEARANSRVPRPPKGKQGAWPHYGRKCSFPDGA